MPAPIKPTSAKGQLHPRNPHQGRYDFPALTACLPELAAFVTITPRGEESIDFADPAAVKALNRALLAHFYGVRHWDIPPGYLCPPIPGRADYVHTAADLLALSAAGEIPRGPKVRILDVGVGANAIYPILAHANYGWQCVGSDIDARALANAEAIFARNPSLAGSFSGRRQRDAGHIFEGVIHPGEYFDLTLCNPPFHASAAAAAEGTQRKLRNLGKAASGQPVLNFGGHHNELWCPGGEIAFIRRMIRESRQFAQQCLWFTTLVSKQENLRPIEAALENAGVRALFALGMAQGQKSSRVVAWSFLPQSAHEEWARQRWSETA